MPDNPTPTDLSAGGNTFGDLRDADPLMFEAEQAHLLLKAAMIHCREALAKCDHKVIRIELEKAEATIDLAEGRLTNAQGCQVKRLHEEDPDDW
jgi:hypothetical protein